MRGAEPEIVTLTVETLDRQGYGRARYGDAVVTLPGALPGETVEAALAKAEKPGVPLDGEVRSIRIASPQRVVPPCAHFGRCGGCAVQHLADTDYLAWKQGRIVAELRRHGVDMAIAPIGQWIRSPPGSRRRIDLSVQRLERGCLIGLNERATHRIVDLASCPILSPALFALVAPLRNTMAAVLPPNARAEVVMNEVDGSVDLLVVPERRAALSLQARTALVSLAGALSVARVSWGQRGQAEIIAQKRPVSLASLGVPVELPPGAFLQASVAAEHAMQDLVSRWAQGARRIVDLYGGVGTLSLPLLKRSQVLLVEGDAAAVAAVDLGLRRAALLGRGTIMRRDLVEDPLQANELEPFDMAILDPPRAGALSQVTHVAKSKVARVAMISCNPDTFARDARLLVDAGFELRELVPIDQFLWSPHIELAGHFVRKRKRQQR